MTRSMPLGRSLPAGNRSRLSTIWTEWHRAVGVALVVTILEVEAVTSPRSHGPILENVVVVGFMGLSVALVPRRPLAALVLIGIGAIVLAPGLTAPGLSGATFVGLYCVVVPPFSVAAWQGRWRAIVGMVLWLAFTAVVATVAGVNLKDVGPAALTAFLAWVAGRVFYADHQLLRRLHERRHRLEVQRAENERLAVNAERTRIASELQTGVAQSVATMVLQAESVWPLLDQDELAAERALAAAEQTGRSALRDMRRILGALRHPTSTRPLMPQPGWDDIDELVTRQQRSGQRIDLVKVGERPRDLPAIIDVTIYRLVESVLEDVHALDAKDTALVVSFVEDRIDLDVAVVGAARSLTLSASMRERVHLCGGAITLDPDAADIAQLHVYLPAKLERVL